jgi:hypothetical protein
MSVDSEAACWKFHLVQHYCGSSHCATQQRAVLFETSPEPVRNALDMLLNGKALIV